MGRVKTASQIPNNHATITFPFNQRRYFIGNTTIKKQSTEIEAMDVNEAVPNESENNSKLLESKPVRTTARWKSGINIHVNKSAIERFMTRYVPELLKHFKRSLIKAMRSNTFEINPRKAIITYCE